MSRGRNKKVSDEQIIEEIENNGGAIRLSDLAEKIGYSPLGLTKRVRQIRPKVERVRFKALQSTRTTDFFKVGCTQQENKNILYTDEKELAEFVEENILRVDLDNLDSYEKQQLTSAIKRFLPPETVEILRKKYVQEQYL